MRNPFKTEASRKYVDLIYEASTTWPSWDPSRKIEPGDFGEIDSRSGHFEKHGNIYDNDETAAIAKVYEPVHGEIKECKQIVSSNVIGYSFEASPQADVLGLAEAAIKTQLEFGNSRGAVLIMYRPRTSYLPGELLQQLVCSDCIKKKVLITEVVSCSSYAMYLSARKKETVKVALLASVPVPASPAVAFGGETAARWWSSNHVGTFEHAHQPTKSFFPLYTTKTLKSNYRRGPDWMNVNESYFFEATEVPWNPLDEDGNEVTFQESEDEEDEAV